MPADLPTPETGSDDAGRIAEEILAGDAYRDQRSLVDRAFDWLLERLGQFFGSLAGSGAGALIGWLIIAGLIVAVIWLVRQGLGAGGSLGMPARQARILDAVQQPEEYSAAHWRNVAAIAEASGQLDDALLARYRALVADLLERGALAPIPGRTPREYLHDLGTAMPAAASTFGDLTDRFETVWYGPAHATVDDLAAFRVGDPLVVAAVDEASANRLAAGQSA